MTNEFPAKALMARVWNLSERLKANSIWNEIIVHRYDGVTVFCQVPGQYWEIDFLEDGRVDVEIYKSVGTLGDESTLEELIAHWGEPLEAKPSHSPPDGVL